MRAGIDRKWIYKTVIMLNDSRSRIRFINWHSVKLDKRKILGIRRINGNAQ